MSLVSSFNVLTQDFLTFLGKFTGLLNLVVMLLGAMFLIHTVLRKPTPTDSEHVRFIKKYTPIVLSIAAVIMCALTNIGVMIMSNRELSGILGIFALVKGLGL